MANPRGLRPSSGNSLPKVTVENLTKTGVFSPTDERKFAFCSVLAEIGQDEKRTAETHSQGSDIFGALEVTESPRSTGVHHTLQRLRSVEVLLLPGGRSMKCVFGLPCLM